MIQESKHSQANGVKRMAELERKRAESSNKPIQQFNNGDFKRMFGKVAPINGIPAKEPTKLDIQHI